MMSSPRGSRGGAMNDVATLSQLELYSTPHSTCTVVTTPVGTSQEVWGSVPSDNNGSSVSYVSL